ncbi:MAG: hypothetical protein K2N42_03055, partial [Anaeroplasmataceae bacterium]|nr:hypothetical protein [Anaeroplasmataceae bacterium]
LKVFKYDFKAIFFKFLPVLAILPVIALLVRLLGLLDFINNIFVGMLFGLFNFLLIMGCSLFMVYTLVICIVRYTKSLFRDQGYLTHTLPVNKHQLFLSQILADFLMELISLAVIILCLILAYCGSRIMNEIVYAFDEFFKHVLPVDELLGMLGGTITILVFMMIFSSLQGLFVIYTGIALGHAFAKNKGILSVVFCIGLNYGLSIINGIISFIFGIATGDLAILNATDAINVMNIYLGVQLAESIAICIGAYFLDIYLMKYRLNLE